MALTKDDVKALRLADVVSFHRKMDGSHSIACTKRLRDTGPFARREADHNVSTAGVVEGLGEDGKYAKCFAMIHSAQYSETWRTVASLLKAGDVVTLRWYADGHSNGYTARSQVTQQEASSNDAGLGQMLHADSLRLEVTRGEGKARKRFTFLIAVSICPDNSARMIRV